jgi:cystathionine beta-lyase/cystathionine gamma-synthase
MDQPTRHFESNPIGGEFGISVELPTLADVIDYEEGTIVLTHGYPRFVAHRTVAEKEHLARVSTGMPYTAAFPSLRQAHFILNDFIQRYFPKRGFFSIEVNALLFMNSMHPGRKSSRVVGDQSTLILVEVDGITVACLQRKKDYERLIKLRRTWGSGFDTHAVAKKDLPKSKDTLSRLSSALSDLEGPRAAGAVLFQSGMAAICSVMLLAMYLKRRVICIGTSYVDTLTIAGRWTKEVMSFHCSRLNDNFTESMLDAELRKGPALIFFETPQNPKLSIPNIPMIAEKARMHDAFMVTDATIATPFNFRPLEAGFDIVIHSTSKFLSGRLNHLGGAAISSSKEMLTILDDIASAVGLGMCENQAAVLLTNLQGFSSRMETINRSAKEIAAYLNDHPKIGKVYYPGLDSPLQEELASRYLNPGRSGVLSFLLKDDSLDALREFYDSVSFPIKKGPGLGGETSLLCPYVMLAHYHEEEEFFLELDLNYHLIRLSVGTEPVDDIKRALRLDR